MEELIKNNTTITLRAKESRAYLCASKDGALVTLKPFGEHGWSPKKAEWRVDWLSKPSWVEPDVLGGQVYLWSSYNKALAIGDDSQRQVLIQTDRLPQRREGCYLRLKFKNLIVDGKMAEDVVLTGWLMLWRTLGLNRTYRLKLEVVVEVVKYPSKPGNNLQLHQPVGVSPPLLNNTLSRWQVGQMFVNSKFPLPYETVTACFSEYSNSGGNINYSGTQLSGDVLRPSLQF